MAVVLVAVCGMAVARTVWHSTPTRPGPYTASLAADGRSRATLQVLSGTTALTINVADLGLSGTLLRVTTPAGSPPPELAADGGNAALPAGNGVIKVSAPDAGEVSLEGQQHVGVAGRSGIEKRRPAGRG
jgi:hypothetical protein